jgi:glutaredoxin
MAKALLNSKSIAFDYIDIVALGKTAAEVTGRDDVRSLPQIYLDGEYIGGFDKLYAHFQTLTNAVEAEDNECKACEG